jgi:hypothetical protein
MQNKPISKTSNFCPTDDMLSPCSHPHPFRFPKHQTINQTSGFGQEIKNQSNQEKTEEFF